MLSTKFDNVNKIWYGPNFESHAEKHTSLGQILFDKLAEADPNRIMQIDGDSGETLTKGEIRLHSIRCAQNLQKWGCKPHDRIGIIARNHHSLTPLVLASLAIGAPIYPLDVSLKKDNILFTFRRTNPTFIFCDTELVRKVEEVSRELGPEIQIFTVNGLVEGIRSINELFIETGSEDKFVCEAIQDSYQHIALIASSSGTTGLPKAICLSHALLSDSFLGQKDPNEFIVLSLSSLSWLSSMWLLISSAMYNHIRLFTSQSFSPELFSSLVEKYKVQAFLSHPSYLFECIKTKAIEIADLSSILVWYSIGGPTPLMLVQNLRKYLPRVKVIATFGITEIGGAVSMTSTNDLEKHPNSVGRLVRGAIVKIVNENTGLKCGIGEQGEICIKMNFPFLGYLGDEETTTNSCDAENFFKTGDLGYFNEDGYLYVVGRIKEIFKNGGHSICPVEIEEVVLKHPGVRAVCVVGIADDDESKISEVPAAVVVRNEKYSVNEDDVYNLVADQLASYKCLDGGIFFVDELPMTSSGKIIRSAVEKIAFNLHRNQRC